jgi:hypothetical protein
MQALACRMKRQLPMWKGCAREMGRCFDVFGSRDRLRRLYDTWCGGVWRFVFCVVLCFGWEMWAGLGRHGGGVDCLVVVC